MTDITSSGNRVYKELVKLGQRKYREQSGLFVAEGYRVVSDILHSRPDDVAYVVTDAPDALPLAAWNHRVYRLATPLYDSVAHTVTPQRVLCVARQRYAAQPVGDLWLVCDGVSEPGNLGSMLRTAGCGFCDCVVLLPDCADAYNDKTVRASMGAIVRLPIAKLSREEFVACGRDVWLMRADASHTIYDAPLQKSAAIVVGNEARGVSDAVRAMPHTGVRIPMRDGYESLGVAAAAAVTLYTVAHRLNILSI